MQISSNRQGDTTRVDKGPHQTRCQQVPRRDLEAVKIVPMLYPRKTTADD